ncbi:phytanoyl-CoA dioxygenase family protein [Dyadobacter sp. LHD-138]|uniref:phytanoyl-CoA dioxygenase family protein n=1 Tax=Dyadobacter sp. LHD-138 TaxID=3071413 RepID=UPI0027DEB2B7|nr:phytanoyl-CoA dioxygenase family protein [Dyadobacter sp. LHD-138]MDQ6477159.1 phytanoyl-CoA dioxygenase family protein [Dyadobacter sp. LHD-138]
MDIELIKKKFDADGYVFLPGFLSGSEIDHLNQKLEFFIENKVPGIPATDVFYEDKSDPSTLKQIMHVSAYEPDFHPLLADSKFSRIAEELLGDKVIPRILEYFNKPPKIGKPTPPHQDGYYFMLKPAKAVTMWMALENVDEANGCVRYVKGSHRKGMRTHGRTQTLGFSQGIVDYGLPDDLENEIAFPAKPGDLLIHDSLTIHRADGNQTNDRSRKALGFIYFGESAKEDVEAKAAYQAMLQKEMRVKEAVSGS